MYFSRFYNIYSNLLKIKLLSLVLKQFYYNNKSHLNNEDIKNFFIKVLKSNLYVTPLKSSYNWFQLLILNSV